MTIAAIKKAIKWTDIAIDRAPVGTMLRATLIEARQSLYMALGLAKE